MSLHPTLDQIEAMPMAAVAALPAEALALLVEDLVILAERSRTLREIVTAALALRYGADSEAVGEVILEPAMGFAMRARA